MPQSTLPAQDDIEALTGHRFPGGHYRIEHWENFLLSGCTGAELAADGLAHPIALFHLPIAGSGTSIADMFALGQAESDLSIMIESYDWEFAVTSAERCKNDDGGIYDRLCFCFEVFSPDHELTARSTITWHYTRGML
jgi:hypothetical protein